MRQMLIVVLAALAALAVFGCASDRNVPLPYSIADSMALPEYKDRLKDVAFYFGNQPHPAIAKTIRAVTTAQRSNAAGSTTKDAPCARAFVSALLRLQSAALKEGGNAVIDIKSNYKHNEVSSETQFQCATGVLMSGVALKGTIVKLK